MKVLTFLIVCIIFTSGCRMEEKKIDIQLRAPHAREIYEGDYVGIAQKGNEYFYCLQFLDMLEYRPEGGYIEESDDLVLVVYIPLEYRGEHRQIELDVLEKPYHARGPAFFCDSYKFTAIRQSIYETYMNARKDKGLHPLIFLALQGIGDIDGCYKIFSLDETKKYIKKQETTFAKVNSDSFHNKTKLVRVKENERSPKWLELINPLTPVILPFGLLGGELVRHPIGILIRPIITIKGRTMNEPIEKKSAVVEIFGDLLITDFCLYFVKVCGAFDCISRAFLGFACTS